MNVEDVRSAIALVFAELGEQWSERFDMFIPDKEACVLPLTPGFDILHMKRKELYIAPANDRIMTWEDVFNFPRKRGKRVDPESWTSWEEDHDREVEKYGIPPRVPREVPNDTARLDSAPIESASTSTVTGDALSVSQPRRRRRAKSPTAKSDSKPCTGCKNKARKIGNLELKQKQLNQEITDLKGDVLSQPDELREELRGIKAMLKEKEDDIVHLEAQLLVKQKALDKLSGNGSLAPEEGNSTSVKTQNGTVKSIQKQLEYEKARRERAEEILAEKEAIIEEARRLFLR